MKKCFYCWKGFGKIIFVWNGQIAGDLCVVDIQVVLNFNETVFIYERRHYAAASNE